MRPISAKYNSAPSALILGLFVLFYYHIFQFYSPQIHRNTQPYIDYKFSNPPPQVIDLLRLFALSPRLDINISVFLQQPGFKMEEVGVGGGWTSE